MSNITEKIDNFCAYYPELLIAQYLNKSKAYQTVQTYITELISSGLIFQLNTAFDINTAVGAQLDILGKYVGIPRFVYGFEQTKYYFEMLNGATPPDDTSIGFFVDGNPYLVPATLYGADIENSIMRLTDNDMRMLIKLKIILNNSFSSFYSMQLAFYNKFLTNISLQDNKNMTMTILCNYYVKETVRLMFYLNVSFIPACVGVTKIAVTDITKVFNLVDGSQAITEGMPGFSDGSEIIFGDFIFEDNLF